MTEEITIQTRTLRLAAKRWFEEGGMPVLGLHGWLDNANTFDRLAPLLRRTDFVSLDLPGHGKSEHRPAGTRYHYTDYVDDVMAAADKLGWEQFTLLGHSMGAGIGCLAASAYPDRIPRLILIEGMGAVTGELTNIPFLLRRSIESMKNMKEGKDTPRHNFEVLVRARASVGEIQKESAELLVRRSVRCNGNGCSWRSDRALTRPYPEYFSNEVMLAFLRGIQAQVLLITADDGMLNKRPYYKYRVKSIKNLTEVMLPGHHHLHLDDPFPVADTINLYLETEKDRNDEQ